MSMFMVLQAQSENEGDDGYEDCAPEDVISAMSHGTSVSYAFITGSGVEPSKLNPDALHDGVTVKPPTVFFGAGASFDGVNVEGVGPPQSMPASPAPPQNGEKALLMLLSKEEREYVLGDLAEEFALYQSKYGIRFAKVWYYKQVVSSAWPFVRRTLRMGVFVWVEEWLRRHI